MKKITAVFLIFLIFLISLPVESAQGELAEVISSTADFLTERVPEPCVSATGGEWTVFALARSGMADKEYFDSYYAALCRYVKDKNGVLHSRKYTEYARVVLALTSIGKNPAEVEGYNLLTPLTDFNACVKQGINGAVWALIALDSKNYGDAQIRDRYIEYILSRQRNDGGWALSESEESADADITAMVLTSLAKYRDRENVKVAVERGTEVLSEIQLPSGGFENAGEENSESTAQVLVAISTLGISPYNEKFVKDGKSIIDALLSYRDADGGFRHTDSVNIMATEQSLYSLIAADRQIKGETPVFDMNEVGNGDKRKSTAATKSTEYIVRLHCLYVQMLLSAKR